MGIDGIMYAAPVSDFIAFVLSAAMLALEMKHMPGDGVGEAGEEK